MIVDKMFVYINIIKKNVLCHTTGCNVTKLNITTGDSKTWIMGVLDTATVDRCWSGSIVFFSDVRWSSLMTARGGDLKEWPLSPFASFPGRQTARFRKESILPLALTASCSCTSHELSKLCPCISFLTGMAWSRWRHIECKLDLNICCYLSCNSV